jgi:hypothetical protein
MATLKNTTILTSGTLTLPVGTAGQRSSPTAGMVRFNSTNTKVDTYQGNGWDDTPVSDGLILHLDAGSRLSYTASAPNTWSDLSGNGRNVTFTNTPQWQNSDGGGVFQFNGPHPFNNSYGSVGSSVVGAGNTAHTTSIWMYRHSNDSSFEVILSQYVPANTSNFYFIAVSASSVSFTTTWQNIGGVLSAVNRSSVWFNLVCVNTGSNAFIYLNGDLMATRGSALTYTGTAGPLVIGRQGETDGEYFRGKLPIIQIYNRALSHDEINRNFAAQRGRFGA